VDGIDFVCFDWVYFVDWFIGDVDDVFEGFFVYWDGDWFVGVDYGYVVRQVIGACSGW